MLPSFIVLRPETQAVSWGQAAAHYGAVEGITPHPNNQKSNRKEKTCHHAWNNDPQHIVCSQYLEHGWPYIPLQTFANNTNFFMIHLPTIHVWRYPPPVPAKVGKRRCNGPGHEQTKPGAPGWTYIYIFIYLFIICIHLFGFIWINLFILIYIYKIITLKKTIYIYI